MVSIKEIEKLSKLSRLELSDAEIKKLQKDLEAILEYVEKLKSAPIDDLEELTHAIDAANVLRNDESPHESGAFSENILVQAPSKEKKYFKVKKIKN